MRYALGLVALLSLSSCSKSEVSFPSADAGKTLLVTTVPKPTDHDIQLPWPDGRVVTDLGGNDRPCDFGCLAKGNARFNRAYEESLKEAGVSPEAGVDKARVGPLLTESLDWTATCIASACSACREAFPM